MSRCYWCFLPSVWKPTMNIDAKSLLLAFKNKQKMEQPFFFSQYKILLAKYRISVWLRNTGPSHIYSYCQNVVVDVLESELSWKCHSNLSIQRPRRPGHMCDDALSWQLNQPMNEFLNNYSISSNRSSLAATIVTLYLANELSFQFSKSLEFSYSCRQIKALN